MSGHEMYLPPTPARATVRRTIEAYARREVGTHAVMRALVAHEDWFVPALHAGRALGRSKLERMVMFGERFTHPAGSLLLYTDQETAHAVYTQGGQLGPYEGGVSGGELFSRIPPDIQVIVVNEGAPQEQKLYLPAPHFHDVGVWVDVLAFEAALAGPDAVAAARRYDAYFVVVNPNGTMATATNFFGMSNVAVLSSAPDCLAAFLDALAPLGAGPHTSGQTNGERIFAALPRMGVDGLVINPCGPGARRVFPLAELTR